MALREFTNVMLAHIKSQVEYLEHNNKLLDIWQGNLKPHVMCDLRESLSENYLSKIESRVIPINILQRLIDKLSGAYFEAPTRTAVSDKDKKLVGEFVEELDFNSTMNDADEFANMHKGYALEPYMDGRKEKLRVIPYDRFTVMNLDVENDGSFPADKTKMTIFIKFMGERAVQVEDKRHVSGFRSEMRDIYFAYTDKEFHAFDSQGDDYLPALEDNDGENPYGVIYQVYGNRSRHELIPVQDTDMLPMTKIIPVLLTDLSGAILFQAFTIIYGINLDAENMTASPNAFWSFATETPETKAEIGTIKPEIDIDKVINFILTVFTLWLETKGIKVGSVGSMNVNQLASGISKVIDEMDTTNLIKDAQKAFVKEEREFWNKFSVFHNYNVDNRLIDDTRKFSTKEVDVVVDFPEPEPIVDREKLVKTTDFEVERGYLPPEKAIDRLYPNLSEKEKAIYMANYKEVNSFELMEQNGTAERDDKDSERV